MSRQYRDKDTGLEITVSRQAERLIGSQNVGEFVKLLARLMEAAGGDWAYVGKHWHALAIEIVTQKGWKFHMLLPRGS